MLFMSLQCCITLCSLFICDFAYTGGRRFMRAFYMHLTSMLLKNMPFEWDMFSNIMSQFQFIWSLATTYNEGNMYS